VASLSDVTFPNDFGFVVQVLKGVKGPKLDVIFVTIHLVT